MAHGFSLHADTAVHGNDREGLERLARYGARGPVAECRLRHLHDDWYEYTTKRGASFRVTAEGLVRRLVALTPPAKLHLTTFHGVFAPNAKLRRVVVKRREEPAPAPPTTPAVKVKRPRLDWATLHRRTFGTDVLRCPCGGRRTVTAVHLTQEAAERRLAALRRRATGPKVFPLQSPTGPPQLALALGM